MPIKLRPYQVQLKDDIYAAWDMGHKNVLAVMPTGTGKTKTFCSVTIDMAILASIVIRNQKLKYPTVILVHRKELVQQISLTLAEESIPHNIIVPRNVIKGIIAAQRRLFNKQFYDYSAPVTVVSVDTLNARFEKHKKWAETIRLWITDEATHLLKNNKWGRAVDYFPNAIGLGVTATPERLDKRGLGRHADGVFDVMVEGPTTRWAIEHGFLCSYKVVIPDSDYRLHLKAAQGDSDYSKEAMKAAALQSHIVGDAVKSYLKFAKGKQAILFADCIETGQRLEKAFNEAGVIAKLLTGETPDDKRLQALLDYKDKKIQQLINVDLFDEGLDVPGIEVVQMCRPTMSKGKYLQMIGRGLRPAPGKEYLIIIDHVGNIFSRGGGFSGHGLPDTRRKWTLDRISKRRDKVNFIRICKNHMCNAPYERLLSTCPYCGLDDTPTSRGSNESAREALKHVDGDLVLLDPEVLRELEGKSILEDPAKLAKRVSAVAGSKAGLIALNNQVERIKTQKELALVIATWAGRMKTYYGYSDRQINKQFYIKYDMTITESLGEPRAEMLHMIEEIIQDD